MIIQAATSVMSALTPFSGALRLPRLTRYELIAVGQARRLVRAGHLVVMSDTFFPCGPSKGRYK